MDKETFFEQALAKVESASIRKWATSDHNRPLFLKLVELSLKENKTPEDFTAFIVIQAIGL